MPRVPAAAGQAWAWLLAPDAEWCIRARVRLASPQPGRGTWARTFRDWRTVILVGSFVAVLVFFLFHLVSDGDFSFLMVSLAAGEDGVELGGGGGGGRASWECAAEPPVARADAASVSARLASRWAPLGQSCSPRPSLMAQGCCSRGPHRCPTPAGHVAGPWSRALADPVKLAPRQRPGLVASQGVRRPQRRHRNQPQVHAVLLRGLNPAPELDPVL